MFNWVPQNVHKMARLVVYCEEPPQACPIFSDYMYSGVDFYAALKGFYFACLLHWSAFSDMWPLNMMVNILKKDLFGIKRIL